MIYFITHPQSPQPERRGGGVCVPCAHRPHGAGARTSVHRGISHRGTVQSEHGREGEDGEKSSLRSHEGGIGAFIYLLFTFFIYFFCIIDYFGLFCNLYFLTF